MGNLNYLNYGLEEVTAIIAPEGVNMNKKKRIDLDNQVKKNKQKGLDR